MKPKLAAAVQSQASALAHERIKASGANCWPALSLKLLAPEPSTAELSSASTDMYCNCWEIGRSGFLVNNWNRIGVYFAGL